MFVPGKPFQPSVMFTGKAGAYPSEAPFRCPTQGYLALNQKHQARAGKGCQGQTL